MYLYSQNNDLQSLTKKELSFSISKGLNFNQFCEMLEKYKMYDFDNSILGSDNYYNLISRSLRNREKLFESFEWKAFQKDKLENTILDNQPFSYKMYLSVPNADLEKFAMRLLATCVLKKVDYDFKINNNQNISRSDNVVIYATDENYQKYIDIIHTVLKESGIKTNKEQHLLAFPYDEDISVAPYIDQNGESFSSIVCNNICRLKKETSSFENFYLQVSTIMDDYFKKIKNGNSMNNINFGYHRK